MINIKKKGILSKTTANKDDIFITNLEGKRYKVTFATSFVWNLLDGKTEFQEIASKINNACDNLDISDSLTVVSDIVGELQKIGLASTTNLNHYE